MVTNSRDTYKYELVWKGQVVLSDVTSDLNRREAEHQERFSGSRVYQVGDKTTREAALKWRNKRWEVGDGV